MTLQDKCKPITPKSVKCDKCNLHLYTIEHDLILVINHLHTCGGWFR